MSEPLIKIGDIVPSLGPVQLPLDGFYNDHQHVFVTSPYIKERMAMINLKDAAIATAVYGKDAYDYVSKGFQGMINHNSDPESFNVLPQSSLPAAFGFIRKLIRIGGIYTFTMNTLNYLWSYHFFGVQPQPFKGFTCYINKNLDSNEGSQMHYALSPVEFLLYGMKVNSICEGEVTEVVTGVTDQIRNKPRIELTGGWKVDEHLGNLVRIRKGFVEITYGGLMKDSIRVKPGDKVQKGQNIARVGCSAWSPIPFLYLQFGLKGARLPIAGNIAPAFSHQVIEWDSHLQCRLFKSPALDHMTDHNDIWRNVDPTKIKYEHSRGRLFDATLCKTYRSMIRG